MQQDKTPTPNVDEFDPNVDPGASKDVPLPPDVEDRAPIEETNPESRPAKDPIEPPPMPLL